MKRSALAKETIMKRKIEQKTLNIFVNLYTSIKPDKCSHCLHTQHKAIFVRLFIVVFLQTLKNKIPGFDQRIHQVSGQLKGVVFT